MLILERRHHGHGAAASRLIAALERARGGHPLRLSRRSQEPYPNIGADQQSTFPYPKLRLHASVQLSRTS
jgi:hypothetical protein